MIDKKHDNSSHSDHPVSRAEFDAEDRQIVGLLREVDVPDDLPDRIMATIADAECSDADSIDSQPLFIVSTRHPSSSDESCMRKRVNWRKRAAFIASTAILLLVAIGIAQHVIPRGDSSKPCSVAQMPELAIAYFDLDHAYGTGRPLEDTAQSPPCPVSRYVLYRPSATTWRHVDDFLGHSATAYDLTPADSTCHAALYVIQLQEDTSLTVRQLDAYPPVVPDWATRDSMASVWYEGQNVYVLVVQGPSARYRSWLDLPTGPLT